jgi:hypothetical protein
MEQEFGVSLHYVVANVVFSSANFSSEHRAKGIVPNAYALYSCP